MEICIYSSWKDTPKDEWELLLNTDDFFLSLDFLRIIESNHKNEIDPNYIILKSQSRVVGILYAQDFKLSSKKIKEYINHSNPEFSILKFLKIQLANLVNLKVSFLGNLFLTNEISFKIHPDFRNKIDLTLLLNRLQEVKKSWLVMIPEYFKWKFKLSKSYFNEILVEPDMHLNIPNTWNSFDDYIDNIQSKYKKRYRKTTLNNKGITKKELNPKCLKKYSGDLNKLFNDVYNKSSFNAAKFNTDTFYDLKELIHNISIVGYFKDEVMVGFSSFIVLNNIMYAHFVGLDYHFNKNYDIYSTMLYDKIEHAIKHKIELIKFGRTANEFKSNFGAIPKTNTGYVYGKTGLLIKLLSPLLKLIKPKKWIQRKPFKEVNNH